MEEIECPFSFPLNRRSITEGDRSLTIRPGGLIKMEPHSHLLHSIFEENVRKHTSVQIRVNVPMCGGLQTWIKITFGVFITLLFLPIFIRVFKQNSLIIKLPNLRDRDRDFRSFFLFYRALYRITKSIYLLIKCSAQSCKHW